MRKSAKRATLSNQLRAAVRDDWRPVRQIAKAAGIDAGNMSRWLSGRAGMTEAAIDRLAAVLGAVIVIDAEDTESRKVDT